MRRSLLSVLILAACSDSSTPATPDAPTSPDASQGTNCLVKADYGAVGPLTGTAMGTNGMTATLEAGPPRDSFFIKLVATKGVFTGGLATGTFTISGADAGYSTCGLCVHIIADIVTGQGPSKFYFANEGTVTLTSTAPIAGSAQNLRLVETDALGNGQPVAGGCSTTIGSISFSM
jgi:hypothetical protein